MSADVPILGYAELTGFAKRVSSGCFSCLEEATIEETDVKRKHSQRMQMPSQGSRCSAFHDRTTQEPSSASLMWPGLNKLGVTAG